MEILILLILFIVVWAITSNYLIIHDIAKKKGYEHNRKIQIISMLPFYGNYYVNELPNLKPHVTKEEFDYLLSPEVVSKKIGFVFLALLILTVILIPVSLMVYVSFKNNFASTLMITFIVILIFLVHQGLVVEYAAKKRVRGYIARFNWVSSNLWIYSLR
ncbi:hypothetical protein [Acholeplasma laidlawii]|uniref:hypothetical protein n=1 Tax=Acholeplasma laidlawii TaxID=2148 RepID=UPI00084C95D4|nr:hypothetical protein [Acholeplasma laidlawii]OED28767.1 hypothetical protein A9268_04065 [Acholeplasma laidlawii]